MGTILACYLHFVISLSLASITHSCVKRRSSEHDPEKVDQKESIVKIPSTKSSSSTENREQQNEVTAKSAADWESPPKNSLKTDKTELSDSHLGQVQGIPTKPTQGNGLVKPKRKPDQKMFLMESASFLNSEKQQQQQQLAAKLAQDEETINDAPSLENIKISKASEELSVSNKIFPKSGANDEGLTTPRNISAEDEGRLPTEQKTLKSRDENSRVIRKRLLITDKTMPSIDH